MIVSETLVYGDADHFFHNIEIWDDFFLVSDYTNDTVLFVYENDGNHFTSYLRKEKGGDFINPEFVKSNDPLNIHATNCMLIDNRHFVKELSFDRQKEKLIINTHSLPPTLTLSSCYNFTSTDIYAVPIQNNANAIFYLFSNYKYYWVRPPLINGQKKRVDDLYLNSLCVNENQNSVVCGMRFLNQVLFYDLDGKLQNSFMIGDKLHLPAIRKGPAVDIPKSTNYFIDIYGTSKYVYCLYDGTADFNGVSDIYVFSWDGQLVKTLKTGQNVKRIAIDKENSYILAIVENTDGWRDVVRFSIKGCL